MKIKICIKQFSIQFQIPIYSDARPVRVPGLHRRRPFLDRKRVHPCLHEGQGVLPTFQLYRGWRGNLLVCIIVITLSKQTHTKSHGWFRHLKGNRPNESLKWSPVHPRLIPFTVLAIFRTAPARVLKYDPDRHF